MLAPTWTDSLLLKKQRGHIPCAHCKQVCRLQQNLCQGRCSQGQCQCHLLGLEPGCGSVSTLEWVAGGVSRCTRGDRFPDLGPVCRKFSNEADPSALWEGDGELLSSMEALGVASDNKFSSFLGGKKWRTNTLPKNIMCTLW